MSALAYVRGGAALAVAVVALAYAGGHLRRRLVPRWHGTSATLAEVLLGLSVLVVVLETVGTFGLLRPTVVMVAVPSAAMALGLAARRRSVPAEPVDPPHAGPRREMAVAFVLVAVVFGQWLAHAAVVAQGGLRDMDSLRYHGPFVARWVQQHSLVHLHHTSSEVQETFFPANAELLHAYGVLLFGRDILTPMLNVAWYGLGVLAAWCASSSSRGRAAAIAGFAALCSTPLVSSIEPGSAKNDITAAVLVLCVVAFVGHRRAGEGGALVLAGLAAGLAVGTKLTVLVPVLILLVGAVWLTSDGRARAAVQLVGSAALTGSFWYVRNLVHTGNPLPWLHRLGPITLPGPAMPGAQAHGFSVLHYVSDASFWVDVAPAGVVRSFGPLFPVLAIGIVGCAVFGMVGRHATAWTRLVGGAALAGMVAYLATPFSAGGTEGHPSLFALDLRFLAPALLLAVVNASRPPFDRWVLGVAAVVVAVDQWTGRGRWPAPIGGAVRALALVAALIGLTVLAFRRFEGARLLGSAALLALVLGGFGWEAQADELSGRYTSVHSGLTAAFALFQNTHDLRVAVGGFADDYPLYGADLSNRVQYIGVSSPDGGFRPASSCRQWRAALAAGHYDDVVLSRSPLARQRLPVEVAWTATDPAAHLVLRRGVTRVFRLDGRPDPSRCPS